MSSYNVWILHMLVSCVIFICRIFWSYRRTLALYWHARAQDKYINWFSRSNLRISPLYSSKRAVLNWNQITLTGFVLRFAKVLRRLFSMKTKSFFFFFNDRLLLQSQMKALLRCENGVSFVMLEIPPKCVPHLWRQNFAWFSYTKQMTHHLKL